MADTFDVHALFTPTPHADIPEWVNDYFRQIASDILDARETTIEPIHVEPFRKFDGQMVFADGIDFNPGSGRGIYYWDSNLLTDGDWVPIF